jgi:hypothetical protein
MYDNDTRFSVWLSEGGAAGIDPDFGGLSGFDGLGRRKRRGRRRAPAAGVPAAVVPAVVRRRRKRAAAAALPASVAAPVAVAAPAVVSGDAGPSFDAAAADGFARAFKAAADAAPAPDVVSVLPGGGADVQSFDTSAPGDVAPDVADVLTAAGEASPDEPMDVETLQGLGKFKIGKAFKSIAKATVPIAAGIVLPAAGAAIGGALVSAASARKGAKGANRMTVQSGSGFSFQDAFGNFISDVAGRVGDSLVDAAGNVVAQQSGGKWVKVDPAISEGAPSRPAAGSGGSSIPWPLVIGGALAFVLLTKKR